MAYDSIRGYEGFGSRAYQDKGGVWTIGYGQTQLSGRPVRPGDRLSRADADKAWDAQVAPYAARAKQLAPNLPPQQNEAFTGLIYNYGVKSPRVAKPGQKIASGKFSNTG